VTRKKRSSEEPIEIKCVPALAVENADLRRALAELQENYHIQCSINNAQNNHTKALQARLTVAEEYVKKCRCLTCKQALSGGERANDAREKLCLRCDEKMEETMETFKTLYQCRRCNIALIIPNDDFEKEGRANG
jgi:hypothetical protein